MRSSPRSWGCFHTIRASDIRHIVFPTLVGVFLISVFKGFVFVSLPHARGGVSTSRESSFSRTQSSPRSWGCFLIHIEDGKRDVVFPTLVGVFLPVNDTFHRCGRLPHARGGVSDGGYVPVMSNESSPRSWGCFLVPAAVCRCWLVFPTLVGVFLLHGRVRFDLGGLPHARGGVSRRPQVFGTFSGSSPRSWGCFRTCTVVATAPCVFPTLVGVFPRSTPALYHVPCLPHARGGVSVCDYAHRHAFVSSPRSWGCFPRIVR